jgi:hypothetical protein
MLAIAGAAGWKGKRSEIYFLPRQNGFRIRVASDRKASVVPIARGVSFSPRSILQKDTHIDLRLAHRSHRARPGQFPAPRGQEPSATQFGVAVPEGIRGPVPPPPHADPHFDCASVLDPNLKGDPNTGCYPAPIHAR